MVAISQIYFVKIYNLSPWYGGGFGMFSTQDVGHNRRFIIYANSDGIKRELKIPKKLAKLSSETANFPRHSSLKKLGKELINEYKLNPDEINYLDFQFYKLDFNKNTLEVKYNLFKTYKVQY